MEEQRSAGAAERQVAKLVEDDEIGIGEPPGDLAGLDLVLLRSRALTSSSGKRRTGRACGDARSPGRRWRRPDAFSRSGSADQDGVVRILQELAAVKLADESFIDLAAGTSLLAKSKPARSR